MNASCVICGRPVQSPGTDTVCERTRCRAVMGHRQRMPPEAFRNFVAIQSRMIRDQERREEEKRERIRHADEREAGENQAFLAAHGFPAEGDEAYPYVAVPHNTRPVSELPASRCEEFITRLDALIAEVVAAPEAVYTGLRPPAPPLPARAFLGEACRLCRGACCLKGGHKAYLAESDLARLLGEGGHTAAELRERYLAHLGGETITDGCVFQGAGGCHLPAELRSNTCHDYYCRPLKHFQAAWNEHGPAASMVVVVRDREHWPYPEGPDHGILGAYRITAAGAEPMD